VADIPAVQTARLVAPPPPVVATPAAAPQPQPVAPTPRKAGLFAQIGSAISSLFGAASANEEEAPKAAQPTPAPQDRGRRNDRNGRNRNRNDRGDRNERGGERGERSERAERGERGDPRHEQRQKPAAVVPEGMQSEGGEEDTTNSNRREGSRRRRGGRNRNRDRDRPGRPEEAGANNNEGQTTERGGRPERSQDRLERSLEPVAAVDGNQQPESVQGEARPGRRPHDKRGRQPRQRHRGNREDLPQTVPVAFDAVVPADNTPVHAAGETLPLDLPVSEPVFQPLMETTDNTVTVVSVESPQVESPANVVEATAEPAPVVATDVSEPVIDNTAQPQPGDFVIPASVLVGMDDSFVAPIRPSSLAASVAEAVQAAALESALEVAPAPSQPAPGIAAESQAATSEAPRERRRAPNDPRNRLPQ